MSMKALSQRNRLLHCRSLSTSNCHRGRCYEESADSFTVIVDSKALNDAYLPVACRHSLSCQNRNADINLSAFELQIPRYIFLSNIFQTEVVDSTTCGIAKKFGEQIINGGKREKSSRCNPCLRNDLSTDVFETVRRKFQGQKRHHRSLTHLPAKNLINPPPYLKEAKKGAHEKNGSSKHKPMMGFEPATYGLRNRCSTPELHRQGFPIIWNLRIYFTPLELLIMESYRCEALSHS